MYKRSVLLVPAHALLYVVCAYGSTDMLHEQILSLKPLWASRAGKLRLGVDRLLVPLQIALSLYDCTTLRAGISGIILDTGK